MISDCRWKSTRPLNKRIRTGCYQRPVRWPMHKRPRMRPQEPGVFRALDLVCMWWRHGGQAVPPNHEIPALTDADGRFSGNLVGRGVEYFFPSARRQLRVEIYAQFEAFRKTGLALDRVNAHNHIAFALYRVGLDSEHRFGVRFTRHART